VTADMVAQIIAHAAQPKEAITTFGLKPKASGLV
jgi:hypothetical protein